MEKYLVEKIDEADQLVKIQKTWEKIYQLDPNSQLYVSWLWFKGWVERTTSKWVVVAVRNIDDDSYVAFLPLSLHEYQLGGLNLIRRINYAGNPCSVYSGFLCLPDHESEAIVAISNFVQYELNWDVFQMKWVRDKRLDLFIQHFSKKKYSISLIEGLKSLVISLPDDYELIFSHFMGKSTRRRTLQKINYIQNDERYRITVTNDQTAYEDIDIICQLWDKRWKNKVMTEWHRHFMNHFYKNNLLRLTILWDDIIPVAALACFLDPVKMIYNAYITSYNPEYSKLSPGIVLFAESIKNAIELKYKNYDFTVGSDTYKLGFGPKQIKTENVSIKRKRLKTALPIYLSRQVRRIIK